NFIKDQERISRSNFFFQIDGQFLNDIFGRDPSLEKITKASILFKIEIGHMFIFFFSEFLQDVCLPDLTRPTQNERLATFTLFPINKFLINVTFHMASIQQNVNK
ncbi:MAG: hypothetical protein L6425_11210, partial [Candidatus Aminicenantes bacterium]|nr:hypothetical protein [Candidatus Aminicenantes bacterium]